LWPEGEVGWPGALSAGVDLLPLLRGAGLSRQAAIEVAVNAVLPVALAGREWPEAAVVAAWNGLPSPGTYGRLRRLEGWIGAGQVPPFARAGRLQGGLLLQADYCSRGRCGACPLSS
jgi:hypothetical protein